MDEPQQELSDSELVQTCLEGRTGAYDALVARHYRGIYNVIYRIVGNAEDASDLTQETFLRAFKSLKRNQSGVISSTRICPTQVS